MGHGIGAISNGLGLIPNPAASVVGTTGNFMSDNILNQGKNLGKSSLTAGGDTLKTMGGLGKGLPYVGLSVVGAGMKAFPEREKYMGMASSAFNSMGQVDKASSFETPILVNIFSASKIVFSSSLGSEGSTGADALSELSAEDPEVDCISE